MKIKNLLNYLVLFIAALGISSPAFAKRFDANEAFYYELTFLGGGGYGSSNNYEVSYVTGLGQFEFGYNLFTVYKNKSLKHRAGVTLGAEGSQYTYTNNSWKDYYEYNRSINLLFHLNSGNVSSLIQTIWYWDFLEKYYTPEVTKNAVGPMVGLNYHFLSGSPFDPYVGLYVVNHGAHSRRGFRAGFQLDIADSVYLVAQIQGENIYAGRSVGGGGGQLGFGFRF